MRLYLRLTSAYCSLQAHVRAQPRLKDALRGEPHASRATGVLFVRANSLPECPLPELRAGSEPECNPCGHPPLQMPARLLRAALYAQGCPTTVEGLLQGLRSGACPASPPFGQTLRGPDGLTSPPFDPPGTSRRCGGASSLPTSTTCSGACSSTNRRTDSAPSMPSSTLS